MQNNRHVTTALSVLIALVGAVLIFLSSVWGIGISLDSAVYIVSARRLDSLVGLFSLSSQYPPGYPVLLALFSILPGDILDLTRLFQCLMFAGNLWIVAVLIGRICRNQGLPILLAPLLFALSATAYEIHFYAWSEGPFIFTQLLSTVFLLDYFRYREQKFLVYAALAASTSIFFRYAGVAWLGASAIVVFLLAEGEPRRRVLTAGFYWLISSLPFAVWLVLSGLVSGETTNREFAVHIVGMEDLLLILKQFGVWMGLNMGVGVTVALLGLSTGVMVRASDKAYIGNLSFRHFFLLTTVYILVYTAFIIFSRSFFDAYIPFDDRIFIPVYFFGYLAILGAAIILVEKAQPGWKLISAVLVGLILLVNVRPLVPLVKLNTDVGTGYLINTWPLFLMSGKLRISGTRPSTAMPRITCV